MKIVLITGDHLRHKYIANKIAETKFLSLIVIQKRESFEPLPPKNINNSFKKLFKIHFKKRKKSERLFFSNLEWPISKKIEIKKINEISVNVIKNIKPDLIISYGCGFLPNKIIKLAKNAWNIHGGLSPWYKGSITLFWPSYMLEPQMTGATIHNLTKDLDSGDIIHQCTADLVRGDGIHDLACRAIFKVGKDIKRLIFLHNSKKKIKYKTLNIKIGKMWTKKNWRPEHLELIYKVYKDKIVDNYLNGKFIKNKPKIFKQF